MFYSDAPITSSNEDLLKRGSFAQLLAKTICNLGRFDTFTIGLYGKWGSGKTSIVKMMLQSLGEMQKDVKPEEKILVVHFEPWNISDSNQLLSQFLVRLSNEFRKKKDKNLKAIGDALEDYSDAFTLAELIPSIGLAGKIISSLGKGSSSFLGKLLKSRVDSKDIQKQKEYVINLLATQPNRILVVIDDIDRLSNEQIRQVFQLVTSVAKFPKTTYLLVFDKEIVVKALECVQEGSGEDYLEKIIQMPIQIPGIQKSEIQKVLFERLDNIIEKYLHIVFSQDRWQRLFSLCVNPFIKQIRDVNRLCNSIEFKLSAISEEVNIADLIALTSIEIGMPALYGWIKANKVALTGYGSEEDYDFTNRTQKEWHAFYEQILIDRLYMGEKTSSNLNKAESTLKILSLLFPHFGGKIGRVSEVFALDLFRRNNQIAHPDKFDRYFHLTVDYVANKHSEVTAAAYLLDANAIVSLLLEKDSEGTCCDFLEEIRAVHTDLSADRASVMIEALLAVTCWLDSSNTRSLFTVKAQDYAEHILYKLFSRIPKEDRLAHWTKLISSADSNKLSVLATILNQLELGYGRLAANGTERSEYDKFLSISELEMVEKAFVVRAKTILSETNLLDFKEWRRVVYLLENFDAEYICNYLEDKLSDSENVLKYLTGSIVKWIGTGIRYEFKEDYKKHLTDERVLQAIHSLRLNGHLFEMDADVQYASAAFCLCMNYTPNEDYEVSQTVVEKTLLTWKQEVQLDCN